MQLIAFFIEIINEGTAQTFHAEGCPLIENFTDAERHRRTADKNIEIAGKIVLQRRGLEQPRHQLFAVAAALEIDGQLQPVKVGFVADVGNFLDSAVFDQQYDGGFDFLQCRGIRDLRNFNAVGRLVVGVFGAHLKAAAAGGIDFPELFAVIEQQSAGGKIRRLEDIEQLVAGDRLVFDEGSRCIANLSKVK